MAVGFKPLLPIILLSFLHLYEDWVSTPSCRPVPVPEPDPAQAHPDDLKVMMVANLLLLGSRSGYLDLLFRDHFVSKFFTRSFRTLRPDMLLVLGDVSARGHHLPRSEYASVIRQFHRVLGPFLDLPLHVALGDRDVGACDGLSEDSVAWITRRLPGLDSAGCGAFDIGNVSFVSLNAVALLCGNSELRFSVEKAVERESVDFRFENEAVRGGESKVERKKERVYEFKWRENAMSAGSGPVVLLHFPLSRNVTPSFGGSSNVFDGREDVGRGPYDLLQKLPRNATEYIFQALKPRIVFSAHTQEFYDHFHPDGTREVTVPAMTWNARDDPGFVIATFRRNGGATKNHFGPSSINFLNTYVDDVIGFRCLSSQQLKAVARLQLRDLAMCILQSSEAALDIIVRRSAWPGDRIVAVAALNEDDVRQNMQEAKKGDRGEIEQA